MRVRAVFVDFGGVIMRTEDKGPRTRLAERLGMTSRDLEKIVFESESSLRASTRRDPGGSPLAGSCEGPGCQPPGSRARSLQNSFPVIGQDAVLLDFLRSLRPERKVGLISNAWSGLRAFITSLNFEDVFDEMIISAEVGLMKPDPRIYHLALEKLGVQPEESVFLDDVLVNVEAARSVGMECHPVHPARKNAGRIKTIAY